MMRNMSLLRMPPLESERWFPAADIYEAQNEFIVYVDVSGVDPQNLSVVAEQHSLTVSGVRRVALQGEVDHIHQLEIERGYFKRTIPMPQAVDTSTTSSTCKDGFLVVRLPKQQPKGKVEIKVS